MPSQSYLERLLAKIRALLANKDEITADELAAAQRQARAEIAGEASGAARRAPEPAAPASQGEPPSIAADAGLPAGTIRLAVSTAPWDGSPARWPSADAYCASCLVDNNAPGQPKQAAQCHLPYKEPTGDINANAVRAINATMHGARGGVNLSPADRASVMARLPGLLNAAGVNTNAKAEDDGLAPVYLSLRLDDDGRGLPHWQAFHMVGDHGVHERYGPIDFTKQQGDEIIRNHAAGVLGRSVPLDFRHATERDGEAGGYVDEFRWGRRGEGLNGGAEPSGEGPILFAHFPEYNDVGTRALTQEHYRHQSPEYDRNYQGKYGAVAKALAATNNPFLRGLPTLQGREQLPVMLDEGAAEEGTPMPPDATTNPPTTQTPPPAAAPAGSVTLEAMQAQVARLTDQLSLAGTALSAADQRIRAVEQVRHEEQVRVAVERAIYAGAPPTFANAIGRIMLTAKPEEPGTIRLSDAADAQPVNAYAALAALLTDLPRVHLGRQTGLDALSLSDVRPADQNSPTDDAYAEIRKRALAAAGIKDPSTNGTTPGA